MTHFFLIQQRHLLNTIFFERYDIEKQSVLLYWEPFPFLAMAGQRTGRSRFGFKMVLLAVLWCALRLKDLKAYQTLAVPGSGAPNKAELQKMTVPQLKAKLREQGKKVSGKKDELIARLWQQMQLETGGARGEKRNIPKAGDTASDRTDVFIPLNQTIQKLEELLEEERVVFIRAGVASGKSTLAEHLARTRSSKYLQVHPPKTKKVLSEESWENELRETLIQESSTSDVANQSLKHIFQKLYENDQVLIFDECHLLFSCPAFCQLLVKKPGYLQKRLKVLMLSAASEAANEQGAIYTTPAEITAKYMWTPPMPNASQLVHQLEAADVYLEEDVIVFFMRLCGGHRSIFMRAMEWVQWMQRENKTRWDVGKVHAEVRQSWASSTWTTDDNSSLLGVLASVRAVRVNGVYKDANKIPKEFVHILCEGPRNDLAPSVRRDLTVHGFLLPSPKVHSIESEEFQPYDWHTVDAKYRVSNHIMGLYYLQVLQKQRQLTVDVDKHPTSCADLLLRAVPFLSFAQVVALPGSIDGKVVSPLSAKGLAKEPRYTSAMVQVLKEQGFQAEAMDHEDRGKVDLQVDVNGKIFAVEALMAHRSAKSYFEHRDRFDNASKPFYNQANYKCLVIIGAEKNVKNVENVKKRMLELRGGIEVVWLAPDPAHTGYQVYVKHEDYVLNFYIPCDRVARSFTILKKRPFYQESSAQKLKFIAPGSCALTKINPLAYLSF